MTTVARVPSPADERVTYFASIDQQRAAMLAICEGCSDEDLRRRFVSSESTILGIVKHLAYVERWWFQDRFAGRDCDYPWTDDDPDAEFRIESHETTEDVLELYRKECEESRRVAMAHDLDDRAARRPELTLRWVLDHMITETARHAGQADILRELADGTAGHGHPPPPTVTQ